MNRIHEYALAFALIVTLIHATRESIRSDVVAEANVTLARLLDEQLTLNQAKLTELEAIIEAIYNQPPRVADSLRMAVVK